MPTRDILLQSWLEPRRPSETRQIIPHARFESLRERLAQSTSVGGVRTIQARQEHHYQCPAWCSSSADGSRTVDGSTDLHLVGFGGIRGCALPGRSSDGGNFSKTILTRSGNFCSVTLARRFGNSSANISTTDWSFTCSIPRLDLPINANATPPELSDTRRETGGWRCYIGEIVEPIRPPQPSSVKGPGRMIKDACSC